MQLPGGQSGHPMSPHYLDLLHDWVHHGRTPLIAGKAEHVLILKGKSA
jgi:penicillin amidase